jgi:hypothetical protein
MGLPDDLVFRTKGEPAIDICAEALADGAAFCDPDTGVIF